MLSCCSSALPYCNAIIRSEPVISHNVFGCNFSSPFPYCPGIGQFQGAVENFSDGYFKSVFLKKIQIFLRRPFMKHFKPGKLHEPDFHPAGYAARRRESRRYPDDGFFPFGLVNTRACLKITGHWSF